jgi:hypothetical protein
MSGGKALLDQVKIVLRNPQSQQQLTVFVDIFDNSLSRKWLTALNVLLKQAYHLEKNYCFFGFVESSRNAAYLCEQINQSIQAINAADLGYHIDDYFTVDNVIVPGQPEPHNHCGKLVDGRMNWLHRYFEDLQGTSGNMSSYYNRANATVKWHIRQLNLLCHELESLVLSMRKAITAPEWRRPSQLMCWLNAPRFMLDSDDYNLFGIETLNRPLGGVFVGVNKAVGKHHWEVFNDEGRDSRVGELISTSMRGQTEAAGDFDIEWANDPKNFPWQKQRLADFRHWLIKNNFDPDDPALTIGHPQIGQVDLNRSFGTDHYQTIWLKLSNHLDVFQVVTGDAQATYDYCWSDHDYAQQQIKLLGG